MDHGIFTSIHGSFSAGLGNQMFIVVAGHITSKYLNIPYYIFKSNPFENPHNKELNDYNESVFKYFGTHLDIYMDDEKFINSLNYNKFIHAPFSPWSPTDIKPCTHMDGYFQYYPPIVNYENEIRTLFLNGLDKHRSSITRPPLNSAFLHIRRGDYLKNPTYHYIQSLEYYKQATDELLQKNTNISTIYVISDDIEWVKQTDFFKSSIYTIYESSDELDTLAFMTLCEGGAICANSTFSWWGAFLGAYAHRNPVFVPHKWIREPNVCLFPSEWYII